MFTISKTAVAKNVTDITVGAASCYAMERVIDNHTDINKNALSTRIGVGLGSSFIVAKVSPVTDAVIDIAAARWHARKDRKQNKSEVVE